MYLEDGFAAEQKLQEILHIFLGQEHEILRTVVPLARADSTLRGRGACQLLDSVTSNKIYCCLSWSAKLVRASCSSVAVAEGRFGSHSASMPHT